MVDLDRFVVSVGFINLSLLFGRVLDLGGLSLEHRESLIESLDSVSEVGGLSIDDSLTCFKEGLLLGSESLLKLLHLSVHLVSNAGAVVGDHVETLKSGLDFSRHAFNHLDDLLVHLAFVLVSGEVFPRSAEVNRSVSH